MTPFEIRQWAAARFLTDPDVADLIGAAIDVADGCVSPAQAVDDAALMVEIAQRMLREAEDRLEDDEATAADARFEMER